MLNAPFKILVFFLFFSVFAVGQNTEDDCQKFIDVGNEFLAHKDYPQALKNYTEAELIARKNGFYVALCTVKNHIGNAYSDLSNYGEALTYYNEALQIAREHKETQPKIPITLNNIGRLYLRQKKIKKSLDFYERAYKIAKETHDEYSIVLVGINLSDSYNKLDEPRKSLAYLNEVKPYKKSDLYQQIWTINYAESLFLLGNIPAAEKMMTDLLAKTSNEKNGICNLCVMELLSKIHAAEGELDKAIAFTKEGLRYNKELPDRIQLFERLAAIYKQKGNLDLVLAYKDSIIKTKDSLSQKTNWQLYESNKIKFNIQEYQNELKINRENQVAERRLYWVIIIAVLILSFFLYRWQKNRIAKQKQEKIIIENKQKITDLALEKEQKEHLLLEKQLKAQKDEAQLKQEKLKNKINEKNRQLSSKALYLSNRNEMISEIINSLTEIEDIAKNQAISNYIRTLKKYLKTDNEWDDFIKHFEKVNPEFLRALKEQHPNLNKKDIRFLCYVYMNLDTKEICTVFNITPNACRKRKRRLVKKMGLDDKENLYDYLLKVK